MSETIITTGANTPLPLTGIHIPLGIQILNVIFIIGSLWGAILLIKDAKHHKGFAKIIRRITGIMPFITLIGSIVITSIIYTGSMNVKNIGTFILIMISIGLISIVTNIRGGILLFIESTKKKKFEKWIRIACGGIMIGSLLLSIITNM